MKVDAAAPGIGFWAVSFGLLLWGLAGASIYVAWMVETPEEFASGAESAANAEAYAEYVANIPAWAMGAGMLAAAARLLGAIGLLLRRAWALPLYIVSVVLFMVALFRAFVLADVASVMSASHIATEVIFLGLGLFAIGFARAQKTRGNLT